MCSVVRDERAMASVVINEAEGPWSRGIGDPEQGRRRECAASVDSPRRNHWSLDGGIPNRQRWRICGRRECCVSRAASIPVPNFPPCFQWPCIRPGVASWRSRSWYRSGRQHRNVIGFVKKSLARIRGHITSPLHHRVLAHEPGIARLPVFVRASVFRLRDSSWHVNPGAKGTASVCTISSALSR